MSSLSLDALPLVQQAITTRPLFVMRLDVRPYQNIGTVAGSDAYRRVGVVPGGIFEGERLSGTVLEGCNDWQVVRGDGSTTLDVRLVLQTNEGAMIAMSYKGIRQGPPEVIARLNQGEIVDPSTYYFRTNPVFETAASEYGWMNGIMAIGVGYRSLEGVIYSIFEVL